MKHFYQFGPFTLDVDKRLLFREGEPIALTPKALDTLIVLVENAGTTLDKEELIRKVWPDSFVEEGNLTVNISTIRKSLGERPNWHQYIATVPGKGYRFVADVKEVLIEDIELRAEETTRSHIIVEREESDELDLDDRQISNQNRDTTRAIDGGQARLIGGSALSLQPVEAQASEKALRVQYSGARTGIYKRVLIGALLLLILAAGSIYYFFYYDRGDSIAVLPFSFSSRDERILAEPDSEYLSDGITESVINSLSHFPELRVIARSSVFHYQGKEIDPLQVGRDLGVRTVLRGWIIQRGDSLTIKTELSDVRENRQIWGEQYDRRISDLLSLQKEIANSIVDKLRLKLTGDDRSRLAKSHTENAEAYELYLKGRYHWNRRTVEGFKKAVDFFQRAIEKDTRYALAYTGLADSYMLLSDWGILPPVEGYSRARDAVLRALSIDEGLAEAHTSLAGIKVVLDWDWAGAENEYLKAIELNPNYPTAHHWYATHLMAMGRFDESLAEIKRAQQLDPLSLGINKDFAVLLLYLRRYDQALEQSRKTLEIDPNFLVMSTYIAQIYELKQMQQEAIAELEKARGQLPDDSEIACVLAQVYAGAGRTAEAEALLNQLNHPSKREQFLPDEMALLYARLGKIEESFEILKKACENHYFPVTKVYTDPRFAVLRSDPRYEDLLRCLRLRQ
jgi:DNA-binding winged helix-turn-helix (wHTH) protein/TolB-like protein/Tfp pilus assembly protein PilF